MAAAQRVLPGATAQFTEPSSLYVVEDATGHACTTCPRTSDDERRRRAAEAAE